MIEYFLSRICELAYFRRGLILYSTFSNFRLYCVQRVNILYASQAADPNVMALFPTNDEVSAFNEKVVHGRQLEVVTIEAEDTVTTKNRRASVGRRNSNANNVFRRPYQRAEFDLADHPLTVRRRKPRQTDNDDDEFNANQAGGLMKTLRLAVNG